MERILFSQLIYCAPIIGPSVMGNLVLREKKVYFSICFEVRPNS